MATIILSAAGFILAGKLGAAIGATVGQQVDRALLGPSGPRGPRLTDLKIQTSRYADPVPKVFGTMRLAGTVIWSTDLIETRQSSSQGKGQPKATTYSYSASFAVALSARPISRVGRIWADGKLLRGAAGDFKTSTVFRLHMGSEDQEPDPLIAATHGIANTPAWRGMAYAVFEDFALADYGNRIPSLSFEIIGDEGGTSIGSIVEGIAEGLVDANLPTALGGFAAYGDSISAVAQTLRSAVDFSAYDTGSVLRFEQPNLVPVAISARNLGASNDASRVAQVSLSQRPSNALPATLTLAFADPARDYQEGSQIALRPDGGRKGGRVELAATLDAAEARGLVEGQLTSIWQRRKAAQIQLPWSYAHLRPADRVTLPGRADTWQIVSADLESMTVKLGLERQSGASLPPLPASGGQGRSEIDQPHGPTVIRLLELPHVEDAPSTAPRVAVAAAGTSPGWRRATLMQSTNGGTSWVEIGATAGPSIMGSLAAPIGTAKAGMFDRYSSIEVTLLHSGMVLQSVSDEMMLQGANVAMLGSELIQFGEVMALGGNSYRLSRLLRGGRGTLPVAHSLGTDFTLLNRDELVLLDIPVGTNDVRVIAAGVGDALTGVEAMRSVTGAAIKPLAPVHLVGALQSGGDTHFSWTRRSRSGWQWLDGVDAPLGEESERYAIEVEPNIGSVRHAETTAPAWIYLQSERLADQTAGATSLTVRVRQIGTFGGGAFAALTFAL